MKKGFLVKMLSLVVAASMFTAGCAASSGGTAQTSKETKGTEAAADKGADVSEEASAEPEKKTEGKSQGSEDTGEVPSELTLYTYYADSAIQQVDRAVELMKETYPDLKINIEHRTDSDGSVLKTRAAVGELPDMFECTGQLTDLLVKSGDLAELDSAIEETGFFEKYLDGNFDVKKSADEHYYAVTSTTPDCCQVFYNKEVFTKLGLSEPKNYDEFKQVVEKLSGSDIIPLALFAQQKWPGLQMFDMAVVGQGQPLGLTGLEDGTTKITDPEYLAAATKISELVSMGLIGKGALNTNASQAFELLETGQAGMLVNGNWFFNDAAIGGYGDKIGYFEYNPFTDAGKEEETHWAESGGTGAMGGYGVNAKGKYAEYSKKVLLTFLECRDIANAELGSLSVLKEPAEPIKPRAESFQTYADSLSNIQTTTKYEWALSNQELIVGLEDACELLLTGLSTPEDYIADLEERISMALGE